jgi:hypothetical protein
VTQFLNWRWYLLTDNSNPCVCSKWGMLHTIYILLLFREQIFQFLSPPPAHCCFSFLKIETVFRPTWLLVLREQEIFTETKTTGAWFWSSTLICVEFENAQYCDFSLAYAFSTRLFSAGTNVPNLFFTDCSEYCVLTSEHFPGHSLAVCVTNNAQRKASR